MRSLDELAHEICTLAGHINAAQHRWLMLIAEYDRRKGWSEGVSQSCAHWLNWKCGIALGAAREKVRVARALENLPKISAAMARGGLSYSKVREITRIAGEESEEYLLTIAEHGTAAHVERLVRAYRRCVESEEVAREVRQQQSRALSYHYDEEGSLVVSCRLPAEAGARLLKALEVAIDALAPSDEPAGFGARRADALGLIAESFLAHGALEARGADRHQIVVHVAAETLRDASAGACHFEQGASMAAETARRLSCDASVIALVEGADHEPLNAGRKTRTISAPLRRLLTVRDKGCRFPGCANSRYIDVHHVEHWANGGETKPSNLVSLCRFHHRAVHEGGIRIEKRADSSLTFVRPDGATIDAVTAGFADRPGDWRQLPTGNLVNHWRGERMDYGMAIDALLARRLSRSANVPAGTSKSSAGV